MGWGERDMGIYVFAKRCFRVHIFQSLVLKRPCSCSAWLTTVPIASFSLLGGEGERL